MEGAEAAARGRSSPSQPRCSSCGSGPAGGGGEAATAAAAAMEEPLGETPSVEVTVAAKKQQGVKRHHHKHNLKHRYELQETLGKGTYGKVKRAIERFSGRVVRQAEGLLFAFLFCIRVYMCVSIIFLSNTRFRTEPAGCIPSGTGPPAGLPCHGEAGAWCGWQPVGAQLSIPPTPAIAWVQGFVWSANSKEKLFFFGGGG